MAGGEDRGAGDPVRVDLSQIIADLDQLPAYERPAKGTVFTTVSKDVTVTVTLDAEPILYALAMAQATLISIDEAQKKMALFTID